MVPVPYLPNKMPICQTTRVLRTGPPATDSASTILRPLSGGWLISQMQQNRVGKESACMVIISIFFFALFPTVCRALVLATSSVPCAADLMTLLGSLRPLPRII